MIVPSNNTLLGTLQKRSPTWRATGGASRMCLTIAEEFSGERSQCTAPCG